MVPNFCTSVITGLVTCVVGIIGKGSGTLGDPVMAK